MNCQSNPFAIEGRWRRGNLHTHTSVFDGDLSPEEMVEKYRVAGYDFVVITDHYAMTPVDGLGDDDLLVLAGEELSLDRFELVAINIREGVTTRGDEDPADLLAQIRRQGGIAYLPHPRGFDSLMSGCLWREEGILDGVFAIEIYNASMEAAFGKGEAGTLWDEILQAGRRIYGVAADDAHWHFNDHRPHDVARAFVMVRTRELSARCVTDALQAGAFYSSTGLLIEDIDVGVSHVTVTCPEARTITALANGARGQRRTRLEKPISPARFEIDDRVRFLRIECEDADGRRAWTNPLVWRVGTSRAP